MWTCRSARITPCFNSTTPLGPTSTQPGVPSILPLGRTGRSMPSEMPSVKASSTWVSGRVGPSTRTVGSIRRLRPDDHHRLLGRVKAVLVEVLGDGQLVARRRTASPRPASVRWQCRAETLTTRFGLPGGPPTCASTISRTICSTRLAIDRCRNAHGFLSIQRFACALAGARPPAG